MPRLNPRTLFVLTAGALLMMSTHLAESAAAGGTREGYIRAIPPETAAARTERHARIARRRADRALIIVHRGAAAFAPENTLEAYAAAMDYGADGCEIDLRRTQEGELVLFHDDMLDALTDGLGTVADLTVYELLGLHRRQLYGTATRATRPPTFAAVLALARQRAMLLYLDVKDTGLDEPIARMLTEADAWDHVVGLNRTTAPGLAKDPRVKLLSFKGPGLYEQRKDVDPESVRAQLARPGQMVMVDDPRVTAQELGRTPYAPVPLPRLRQKWPSLRAPERPVEAPLSPPLFLRKHAERRPALSHTELLDLLESGTPEERSQPDGTLEYQRRRTEQIVARAWAAQRLAQIGLPREAAPRRRAVELLERQVRQRSYHRDWQYHALDGAMAVRALGALRVTESAALLTAELPRVDPDWKRVQNPEFGPYPVAYVDFRVKMAIFPALGMLRTVEAKRALLDYIALEETAAREITPPAFEDATRALLRCRLSQTELTTLLQSKNLAVRGTAILECRDHPTPDRTAALKATQPWALTLPAAVR
jgi:glycerophosphoryl diester phosphodiesterase